MASGLTTYTTDFFVMKFTEEELFLLRSALSVLKIKSNLDKDQNFNILKLSIKLEKQIKESLK